MAVEKESAQQMGGYISLFGQDVTVKEIVKKVKKAEEAVDPEVAAEKLLKSKKVALSEKLTLITNKVLAVLGRQSTNVLVIKTKQQLINYIDKAIAVGRIAVDTETNNSLDPVTCKLMGPCLYVPGEKQAYIPLNHRDPETKERLNWQLTEEDCREQFQRLVDAKTFIVMHNGKFDYEVIKCTCGIELAPDWDTIIAARLLNENEAAGLKDQYVTKIDPSQSKYDISSLFENVAYADVDPDIFALYAATDSMMTDKLYEYQKKIMELPENDKLYNFLFKQIEMPIVKVTAEMELAGVAVDMNLGDRLKEKYENQLATIDAEIENVIKTLEPTITAWRLSAEANEMAKQYAPKKTKKTAAEIEESYPEVDKDGKRYKLGKPKALQLPEEINLGSPVQLAIIFYDVLKCGVVSKKAARGTGSDELKALAAQLEKRAVEDDEFEEALEEAGVDSKTVSTNKAASDLCSLILKRRGVVKLISTYIDVIPTLAKHWPDGRIRFHLNSLGTDTGRYSSGGKIKYMENEEQVVVSGINIQNIPSHNKEIRMLFKAETTAKLIEAEDNEPFIVDEISDIETTTGWVLCKDLNIGDMLLVDDLPMPIKAINYLADLKQYSIEV